MRCLAGCGMFEGGREAREHKLAAWPFERRDIGFVLLTHAHIDHAGLLPHRQVLVDSPMAHKVAGITWRREEFPDHETRALLSLRQSPPQWPQRRGAPARDAGGSLLGADNGGQQAP